MIACFVAAGIMGLISGVLFLSAMFVSRSERDFAERKVEGLAKVVGYEQNEGSAGENLSVKLLDIEDPHAYYCSSNARNATEQFPVGSIIKVEYAPKKIFGKVSYEVHLADQHWGNTGRSARGFRVVAGCVLVIALLFLIAGFVKMK